MINETILAIIIAFAVSAILCPIVIPFLHKLKFGQQVREDGPQAHLKKHRFDFKNVTAFSCVSPAAAP